SVIRHDIRCRRVRDPLVRVDASPCQICVLDTGEDTQRPSARRGRHHEAVRVDRDWISIVDCRCITRLDGWSRTHWPDHTRETVSRPESEGIVGLHLQILPNRMKLYPWAH